MRFAHVSLSLFALTLPIACATTSTNTATTSHATTTTTTTTTTTYAAIPFEAAKVIGAPPSDESQEELADLAAVKRWQKEKGGPRWTQAQHDDDASPFAAFGSVLGPSFTKEKAPKTAALFKVLFDDTSAQTRPSKTAFARKRPPLVDASLETCAPLEKSPSYPSGHAARGWMMALVLADMVPEKADELLARGREYGESRIVCAEHFPTDVEAGRLIGAAVFASASADQAFKRDESAAKAELRALLGLTSTIVISQ